MRLVRKAITLLGSVDIDNNLRIMKNLFWIVILWLSFTQCSREELPIYHLTAAKQVEVVSDTLLLHDIKCLTFHENRLYFANPVYDQIILLNKDLGFENVFGKKGKGPNELLGVNQFAVNDSLISVLNVLNRRINVFSTTGTPVSETVIASSIMFDPSYRYCFIDTAIIGCSFVAETPLSKYDIYTKRQTLFGETYEFSTPKQTQIRNNRFTSKVAEGFIAVSNNLPSIEIYNQHNLERIAHYDYSDISQVKHSIQAIEEKPDHEDNSYRHLCEDIYVTNQHLYVLLIDYSNNNFNVNQIIKFEINPVIKPVAIYKLPGKHFTTFCVSEEEGVIYAYRYTDNTLGAYPINQ